MSGRFVTFNAITRFDPGGITKINSSALAAVGIGPTGIVAILGEADEGKPREVVIIDDPAGAKELFGSGPLADSIRVAFDPSNDIRIPGGAFRVLAYKVNSSTQASSQLPGDEAFITDTAAMGSTPTVVALTTGGLVADEQIGRWLWWDGGAGGIAQVRRIVDNEVGNVTVSPGFSESPVAADVVQIRETQITVTSTKYGVGANSVSFEFEAGAAPDKYVVTLDDGETTIQSAEILGEPRLDVKYVGGPVQDSGGVVTAIAVDGLSFTLDAAAAPSLDEWAGMTVQFSNGLQRLVAGNSAVDPSVVTLDSGHALSSAEQLDLAGSTAVILAVTAGTGSITGAAGAATGMTTSITPADDLSLTFEVGETINQFADRVNATTNYEVTVPDGTNGDVVLIGEFDFGTVATGVTVLYDNAISGRFRRDLHELVEWINDFGELATATRATTAASQEGSEIPTVTAAPVYLEGGTRGTSSNSDWQAGLDAFAKERANHVVPLISENLVNQGFSSTATFDSVAAQLKAHVQDMRGAGQSERGGYIGMKSDRSGLLSQVASLNDTDVQFYGQKFTTLDVDGNLKEMDEWSQAVSAAGMRSGAPEVGEPLTFKLCKTTGLTQDSSWDPADRTDRNAFIAAGIMFAEESPTAGFRWVRDLTTHVTDDNIALIDAHTRDAVRFIAYDLRKSLEDRFTGEKATPANVASMREHIAAKMSVYLENNIIVRSDDPENPTGVNSIPGFRRLRVSVTGNTASIKVEIFPVTGIVFQLSEIFLQLPLIV